MRCSAYIDDFHVQALELPEDPEQWHSDHEGGFAEWLEDDTVLDKFNGETIKLPFNFWIMRNVREALQTLTTQS